MPQLLLSYLCQAMPQDTATLYTQLHGPGSYMDTSIIIFTHTQLHGSWQLPGYNIFLQLYTDTRSLHLLHSYMKHTLRICYTATTARQWYLLHGFHYNYLHIGSATATWTSFPGATLHGVACCVRGPSARGLRAGTCALILLVSRVAATSIGGDAVM